MCKDERWPRHWVEGVVRPRFGLISRDLIHRPAEVTLLLGSLLSPNPAQAQQLTAGATPAGIEILVLDEAYIVGGPDAPAVLQQLRSRSRLGLWTSFPCRYRWSYRTRVVPTSAGLPSDKCKVTEFELGFTVTAHYPRWVQREGVRGTGDRGVGELRAGPRPCEAPTWNTIRPEDLGTPAPAGDWAGRNLSIPSTW